MNLSSSYAAVIEKRPDLAVESLEYHDDQGVAFWTLDLHGIEIDEDDPAEDWKGYEDAPKDACSILPNQAAAALILAHWVQALPRLTCVYQNLDGWVVCSMASVGNCPPPLIAPTLIEALAAYLLRMTQ